jgi:molecular chaperone GrpE
VIWQPIRADRSIFIATDEDDGMADPKSENNQDLESDELETAAGGEVDIDEVSAEGTDSPEEELSLEEMVAKLEADVADAQDSALRAQADAANVQRRAEQEIDKARKFALDRFVGELLPVVDNMERALSAATDSGAEASIIEGLELTLKSFMDALKKSGVEIVDPQGEPFDPQLAQAMSMVENPDVEPNTVIAVMQKGYTLNGRLVRPAMVMVSKAAE